MPTPIVVGIDGSARAWRALDWAADRAVRHRLPLLLVHGSRALLDDGTIPPDALRRLTGEREDLLAEARRVEAALWARIGDWAERFPVVGEVRGKGAMFGVELVRPGTKDPNPEALTAVLKHATTNGVIALDAGSWDSVLRIMPSVVISEALIDDAATVLEEALARL
jgi:nucleotide-binding universal stress UspA family protein